VNVKLSVGVAEISRAVRAVLNSGAAASIACFQQAKRRLRKRYSNLAVLLADIGTHGW